MLYILYDRRVCCVQLQGPGRICVRPLGGAHCSYGRAKLKSNPSYTLCTLRQDMSGIMGIADDLFAQHTNGSLYSARSIVSIYGFCAYFWDPTISNPTRGAQLSMFAAHLHFVLSAMRDERLITNSVCMAGRTPNKHARF